MLSKLNTASCSREDGSRMQRQRLWDIHKHLFFLIKQPGCENLNRLATAKQEWCIWTVYNRCKNLWLTFQQSASQIRNTDAAGSISMLNPYLVTKRAPNLFHPLQTQSRHATNTCTLCTLLRIGHSCVLGHNTCQRIPGVSFSMTDRARRGAPRVAASASHPVQHVLTMACI